MDEIPESSQQPNIGSYSEQTIQSIILKITYLRCI